MLVLHIQQGNFQFVKGETGTEGRYLDLSAGVVAMMRWAWVVGLFAFTTATYAQAGDKQEATTLILCFPKKFLKTEADPISATLIRYGVSKEGYEGLQVIHLTISGKEFDRGEQHKDTEITTLYNLEKTLNLQIIWKGVLKTDPHFSMSGNLDFRNENSRSDGNS